MDTFQVYLQSVNFSFIEVYWIQNTIFHYFIQYLINYIVLTSADSHCHYLYFLYHVSFI